MSILSVGAGLQFSTLSSAIAASSDGDTIQVQAGTYTNDFATITKKISVVGVGGMVHLVATQTIPNGKAILVTTTDVTLDHIEFSGARVTDGNGAGVRYEGGNLTLTNCYFHDNQDGLLAGASPSGSITIDRSEFAHNGTGDGFTHNLYVGEVGTLRISNSYFHDAVVGHEIKSRADQTIIENSRIVDGPTGTASYSIDLPNGGAAIVRNNVIEQGPGSQNPAIIHFGGEGTPYGNSGLQVIGNTILNDLKSSSAAILNQTGIAVQISGNHIYGLGSGQVASGPNIQSGNDFLASEPALDASHPWSLTPTPVPAPAPAPTPTPSTDALIGTGGNDTLVVTAATHTVDGGAGNDTVAFAHDRSWYTIAATADGGLDVTDVHATGQKVHVTHVETLAFASGSSYAVAPGSTSVPTPAPAPTPPPAPAPMPAPSAGALIGSNGNDTLIVTAAALSVDGGAGNDTAAFAHDRSWYAITAAADGGLDVTDVHATGQKVHVTHVETLTFASGASYTVAPSTDALIGTGGNDTLVVTAATRSVDGGTGNDTAVFAHDRSWYAIAATADGGFDVTDVHATGQKVHVTHVETLAFASGGSYAVAPGSSPAPSPAPAPVPTPAPSPAPSASATVITAPELPQAAHSGEVVDVRIENNADHSEASRTVTFGQVFTKGDVPAGTTLVAIVDGREIPVQMDVKATNDDGSVRHAILTVEAPALEAHGHIDLMLARGAPASAAPSLSAADILARGYDGHLTFAFHNADGSTTAQSIDVGVELAKAIASGTAQTWLQGPQATEVRVDVPVNDQMHATFDIRVNADNTFKTDVSVWNDAAYKPAATFTYDVTFKDHGTTLYSDANIQQYQYSSWHQEVWSGKEAPVDHVVYDAAYLTATGAVPGYDTSLGVKASAIGSGLAALAKADAGPMGSALVTEYMPQTGGRPDIGPTTAWTANYLVSQDEDAEKVMLANADAGGSVPWHFRDASGRIATIDSHPNLWIDSRGTPAKGYGTDSLTTPYNPTNTGWAPDSAHAPDLQYVPYLVTGSHYYLDQLQAQANYMLASGDPGYRGGSDGIFYGQIRNIAWQLRDVANTAYITPDGDPLKGYFTDKVEKNIDHLVQTYVTSHKAAGAGETEGYVLDSYHPDTTAPWQQDFLAMTLANTAAQGFGNAETMAAWMQDFVAGRFINGDSGFDPLHGPAYYLTFRDPAGNFLSSWEQLYDANFAGQPAAVRLDGTPDGSGGYAAYAKAATASLFSLTHDPDAIEAYAFLVSQTAAMAGDYQRAQTFDITPTLPNGHHLLNSEISVAAAGGGTLTAAGADALLAGSAGNDALTGGSGIGILYGGAGNDTLTPGSGSSYLFGGDGNDRLIGHGAASYMKGGAGADVFVFTNGSSAHDSVADFQAGVDRLEIQDAAGALSTAALVAGATATAAGDAVLHLGAGHDVTLIGVTSAQLHADWLVIVH